ncbi:MAG: outer membrane lipoprotein-sorting protein [Alkalispirochaeta sp.]
MTIIHRIAPSNFAVISLLAIVISATTPGVLSAQDDPLPDRDPQELLTLVDETLFPDSFVATFRMTTERPGRRTTEMLMENSHLEGSGTFMEVEEPRRSRGMRFLQKENDLWMYNPRSGSRRAVRLSPRDSFQGSVFSNNDVSDPDYSDDYTAGHADSASVDHPQLGTIETTVIEARAAHDEAAYGRIEIYLWHAVGSAADELPGPGAPGDVIPVRFDYYSRSGLPFKRMLLLEIGELAGATRPAVMRMESLEEEGAVTTVRIEALEAREDIPQRLFNQQELTR